MEQLQLLDLSKKARREVKKLGMAIEKEIKAVNFEMRTKRGAVTGGVKSKRAVNDSGLRGFCESICEFADCGEVIALEGVKEGFVVSLVDKSLSVRNTGFTFIIHMVKGKISLNSIAFYSTKDVEGSSNVATLKEFKDSLKSVANV